MMNKVFEDPYKAEGIIQFKIEKMSKFARVGNVSSRRSEPVYVRGLPWKILAMPRNTSYGLEHALGYFLQCNVDNTDEAWSCDATAQLKLLSQKEGKEDLVRKVQNVFHAKENDWGFARFMSFETLMDPEQGWYDEETDSIKLQVHFIAHVPHGVKNMPDCLYTKYAMRSEHPLFVELKDGNKCLKSSLSIEDKLWSFTYSPSEKMLNLEIAMHESDNSKTTAECIFWYWNDKEIVIMKNHVYKNQMAMEENNVESGMKTLKIVVPTDGIVPANKKFNVVIRLLDKRITNSLESYYGEYAGVETITLWVANALNEETSFVVPKLDLMRSSPVFQQKFANEMTENTGKVVIEDTNPEEFGDFLKAISPKQEHPTPSNVFALLKLADRYKCQLLRDRCELHLLNCVEIPLIHLIKCANSYGLEKLKNNLRVSVHGTGLFELLQQTKPYLGLLNELTQMG